MCDAWKKWVYYSNYVHWILDLLKDSDRTVANADCRTSHRVDECVRRQEFAVVQEDALAGLLLVVDLTSLVCGVIGSRKVLEEERVANYRDLVIGFVAELGLHIGFKFIYSFGQVLNGLCSLRVGLPYGIQSRNLRMVLIFDFILTNHVLCTLLQVFDEPISQLRIVVDKKRGV